MPSRLAVSGHLFLRPLLHGLERPESSFQPVVDIPARIAKQFSERAGDYRCAFLSPIDYARYGADFCIVPGIAVSSAVPNGVIRLLVKSNVRNIRTVAVDIRVTTEILLAKIILLEKFRNEQSAGSDILFVPMLADPAVMLQKADAALVVSFSPMDESSIDPSVFAIDLVEEWMDLTDLPYVFGFWVGREGELEPSEAQALVDSKTEVASLLPRIAQDLSLVERGAKDRIRSYFDSFSYELGATQEESLAEFFHYAYFHGALKDIPEVQYFDLESSPDPKDM